MMNISYKRVLSLITAFIILFAFVACNPASNADLPANTGLYDTNTDPAVKGEQLAQTTYLANTASAASGSETQTDIKNMILIIGDGMGPEHISAGQLASGKVYDFTRWQNVNVNTQSVNSSGVSGITTDSAASATALATGTLTVNGYLGIDHTKKNIETILDHAKAAGKATGVLTTDNLYGATPSGFSAHSADRNDSATITATQMTSGVDFLCGLRNDSHYSSRKADIESNGYYFSNSTTGLKTAIANNDKLYLTLDIENGASGNVELSYLTDLAIDFLDDDEDGFVLIIEQAHIDKYAHSNNISGVVKSMNSLAKTVDTVMEWIGDRKDTAVLVTADHETGGLNVSTQRVLSAKHIEGEHSFYYRFMSTSHTNTNVKLFVYGFEADFSKCDIYKSNHIIKNINIFDIMLDLLTSSNDPAANAPSGAQKPPSSQEISGSGWTKFY